MRSILILLVCYWVRLATSQTFSTGGDRTCAISDNGDVRCWGEVKQNVFIGDGPGEMGDNIPVVDLGTTSFPKTVHVGTFATCVLFVDGRVKCWGKPSLAYANGDSFDYDQPSRMGDNLPYTDLGTGVEVQQMCLNTVHACVLTTTGRIKCWGYNLYGQLGLGDTTDRGANVADMGNNLPFVDLGNGVLATQISCEAFHTCAILTSGDLKCWGNNGHGQLGLGDTEDRGDEPGEMGNNLPVVDVGASLNVLQVELGNNFLCSNLGCDDHTCALLSNGQIKCWGNNDAGQLGYENTTERGSSPGQMGDNLLAVDLGSGVEVSAISLGSFLSCALLTTGDVKCWGFGASGALGQESSTSIGDALGTMGAALPPIDLGTTRDVFQISAGGGYVCAVFEVDFSMKCWGNGNDGKLGLGDTNTRGDETGEMGTDLPFVDLGTEPVFDGNEPTPSPTVSPTSSPTYSPYIYEAPSQSFSVSPQTCAILDGREVRCWGWLKQGGAIVGDEFGEMGINTPVVDLGTESLPQTIYVDSFYACVLFTNRRVKCWGDNTNGRLGSGHSRNIDYDDPAEMGDNLPFLDLGTGVEVVNMCVGSVHACALTTDGRVKCWGDNGFGQLGLGDTTDRGATVSSMGDNLPSVDLGNGLQANQVECGLYHTCVVLQSGDVKCWGRNDFGQLGLGDTATRGDQSGEMGTNLPLVNLGSALTALEVTSGYWHTCALLDDGRVKCWGRNDFGQLGLGDITGRGDQSGEMGDSLPVVDLGRVPSVTHITGGVSHTCVLLFNGEVKCWGLNVGGQLGLGDTDNRGETAATMGEALPSLDFGTALNVIGLDLGGSNNCVSFAGDNSLKCWGLNGNGQLGLGDSESRGDDSGEMGVSLPFVDLGTGRSIFDGATVAPSPEPTEAPVSPTGAPTGPTLEPTTAAPTEAPDRTDMIIGIAVGVVVFLGFVCLGCSYYDSRAQERVSPI